MDHSLLVPLTEAAQVDPGRDQRRGFRPRELARQLGVAPNVIYAAIYSGDLPVWRLGKTGKAIVIPAAAIETWLASRTG